MTTESVTIAHIPRAAYGPHTEMYARKYRTTGHVRKLDGSTAGAPMIRGGGVVGPLTDEDYQTS